jgi:hypothetical protein
LLFSVVKVGRDLGAPLVEKFLEVVDHLIGWSLGAVDILGLLLPLSWILVKDNVGRHRLESFS